MFYNPCINYLLFKVIYSASNLTWFFLLSGLNPKAFLKFIALFLMEFYFFSLSPVSVKFLKCEPITGTSYNAMQNP